MGRIINTTNIIDDSMSTNARVYKNMSSDNYYLKELQTAINYKWKYRYNVVDIEEENVAGTEIFEPIEVVINEMYSPNNKNTLSDDWKKITFKDIKHPTKLGKRYRFSLEFDNPDITDLDKSIWITLQTTAADATESVVIRRCDTFFVFLSNDEKEIHYEPVCLDSDFKYIALYRDETITVPQAEVYAVMQYNQYTKNVKINDRFFVGSVNMLDDEDNSVFKVTGVRKFNSLKTYDVNSVPLIYLALEKCPLDPEDNRETRVAEHAPRYNKVSIPIIPSPEDKNEENVNNYEIRIFTEDGTKIDDKLLLNKTRYYSCYLYNNDNKLEKDIDINVDLLSTINDTYYYIFEQQDGNHFSIYNKKAFIKDKLKIVCKSNIEGQEIIKEVLIELGGNS